MRPEEEPPSTYQSTLTPYPRGESFERLGVDIIGPLKRTRSGNKYIVCFTDYLTKWAEAFPVKRQTAEVIASLLVNKIIFRFGSPATLLSDRGTQFLGRVVRQTCKLFKIKKVNTTAYHPQCDGLTEKFNSTIVKMLSKYCDANQNNWDEFIDSALFAYRTSPLTNSTHYTPFYMLYGREARNPSEVKLHPSDFESDSLEDHVSRTIHGLNIAHEIALANLQKHQDHMKRYQDRSQNDVPFRVGDQVYLYSPVVKIHCSKKLSKFWKGPFVIVRKTSPVNYNIRWLHTNRPLKTPVHANRLKHALARNMFPSDDDVPADGFPFPPLGITEEELVEGQLEVPVPDSEDADNEVLTGNTPSTNMGDSQLGFVSQPIAARGRTVYPIEKILGKKRAENGETRYKIRWRNYSDHFDSFEPFANLDKATKNYVTKKSTTQQVQGSYICPRSGSQDI